MSTLVRKDTSIKSILFDNNKHHYRNINRSHIILIGSCTGLNIDSGSCSNLKYWFRLLPKCKLRPESAPALWLHDHLWYSPEVAGVNFSDSDSTPIPKCLNPGPDPAVFLIWESDSCSDSGYNHQSNRHLPMFYLKNDYTDSCYCGNWKVTPGPVFHKFLTPSSDP